MTTSPSNPFEKLYAGGGWNASGSGLGSQLAYARDYIIFLENFIRYNRVQSVVDFGCGDWAFSKFINWGNTTYLGIDCVPSVIARNSALHANANTQFRLVEFGDFSIPPCNLLIAKDVLQHLPYDAIHKFLAAAQSSDARFVLLTNDFAATNMKDIEAGGYRRINLGVEPFEQKGAIVFCFGRRPDDKVVFLL